VSDISRSMEPITTPEDITSNTVNSNAGGNALLDAENALSRKPQPEIDEDDAAATNFSETSATQEPSDGKTITTTGAYPVNQSQFDKAEYSSPTIREEDPAP
jgi:hypothetical protein